MLEWVKIVFNVDRGGLLDRACSEKGIGRCRNLDIDKTNEKGANAALKSFAIQSQLLVLENSH